MGFSWRFLPIAISLCVVLVSEVQAQVQRIDLSSEAIKLELTPNIGGRLLSVALKHGDNFLKVGESVVSEPDPYVAPTVGNIGYLAQEIWVGPQSQWWQQQRVNAERAAEHANWPPDPYLILATNKLLSASAQQVVLQSPASPVTGLQLTKTYRLDADNPNGFFIDVSARNFRDSSVAWDIWFNLRTAPQTQVYVPVDKETDVRVDQLVDETYGPITFNHSDKLFHLNKATLAAGKTGVKGKVFIQPAKGWMAGFQKHQVLIVKFALAPLTAIHPEQGQVEFYWDFQPALPQEGLLEMELHTPYRTLQPDETMAASQHWILLPYTGSNSYADHVAFLRKLKLVD